MTKDLTMADRLRVYAKTGHGHVTVTLTDDQAERWAQLLDMGETIDAALRAYEAATAALIVQRQRLEAAERRSTWAAVAVMAVFIIAEAIR